MLMSDAVALGILGVVSSTISAIFAYLSKKQSYETSTKVDAHQVSVTGKIDTLTAQTNGLTEALIKSTGKVEFSRGVEQGKIEGTKLEQDRTK